MEKSDKKPKKKFINSRNQRLSGLKSFIESFRNCDGLRLDDWYTSLDWMNTLHKPEDLDFQWSINEIGISDSRRLGMSIEEYSEHYIKKTLPLKITLLCTLKRKPEEYGLTEEFFLGDAFEKESSSIISDAFLDGMRNWFNAVLNEENKKDFLGNCL